jgi:hypothetical protein
VIQYTICFANQHISKRPWSNRSRRGPALMNSSSTGLASEAAAFSNTTAWSAAVQSNSLGVGLSGSGFLVLFYTGVVGGLQSTRGQLVTPTQTHQLPTCPISYPRSCHNLSNSGLTRSPHTLFCCHLPPCSGLAAPGRHQQQHTPRWRLRRCRQCAAAVRQPASPAAVQGTR